MLCRKTPIISCTNYLRGIRLAVIAGRIFCLVQLQSEPQSIMFCAQDIFVLKSVYALLSFFGAPGNIFSATISPILTVKSLPALTVEKCRSY